ncbi:MAG: helix-turn-helix domain-containing protein [Acidimicrobiales bacterium]
MPKVVARRAANEEPDHVLRALECLVVALETNGTPTGSGEDGNLLLDTEVDGVRCTFRRVGAARPTLALSPREREISRMVASGYTNKMIAKVLEISLWTVSTHLRRIFAKLGVSSRAAMVAVIVEARIGTDAFDHP